MADLDSREPVGRRLVAGGPNHIVAAVNVDFEVYDKAAMYADGAATFVERGLGANECGDMAIGYTKSSASIHPAVFATGRRASGPAGSPSGEVQVKAGETNCASFEPSSPRRWGDHTGMAVDPDGSSFWYLGEHSKNTGTTDGRWGNWIAELSLGPCGDGTIFSDGFENHSTSAWSSTFR